MSRDFCGVVDLRSDTVTRPAAGMRQAMASAEVGDDVLGEDPTVNRLQERVAAMMGKEAALFVPTGTMANLIALLAQTRPGDTVVLHEDAHPFNYESGGMAMVGGVMARPLPGPCGILAPETVAPHIQRVSDHHYSPATLVSIENTTNRGGGAVYPLDTVAGLGALVHEQGIRLHCDGARIFNAAVALGLEPAAYAEHADTVSFCFSKGLGAPAGSMVVGDCATIDRAHRYRKMLGGGMRQAGVLAAAGLYALDYHVERLADDHARARRFREVLEDRYVFPLPSPTNIVYIERDDAASFVKGLAERGVLALAAGPQRIRVVFHLDVSDEGLDHAVRVFGEMAR